MDQLIIEGKEGEYVVPPDLVDTMPPADAAAITATIRVALYKGYDVKAFDGPHGEMIVRWKR